MITRLKYLLFIPIFSFYNVFLNGQIDNSEIILIIKSNGDSIVSSKIYESKTNEDQVTFVKDGKRRQLKSEDVRVYYGNGKRVNITVNSKSKLVTIVENETLKLARSNSSKGIEHFYLFANGKWSNLYTHALSVEQYLFSLIPDFEKIVGDRKIRYNLPSLARAVSKYNEYKDSGYRKIGSYNYPFRIKYGIFGSIGSSNIFDFSNDFKRSITRTIGFETHFRFSRIYSSRIQFSYVQNSWKDDNLEIALKTINVAALLDTRLYSNYKNLEISTAFGVHLNSDLDSEIRPYFSSARVLGRFGIGYDAQLHFQIGRHFNLFASYQIRRKLKGQSDQFSFIRIIKFGSEQYRLGTYYIF